MTKLELAYCAGVVDSDGSIGMDRKKYATNNSYNIRVSVVQKERQAVNLFRKLFGGAFYLRKPQKKINVPVAKAPMFVFVVTNHGAERCLKALLPYLRIKKGQALNCLKMVELINQSKKARLTSGRKSKSRPRYLTVQMDRLFERAHELNGTFR